MKIEPFPDLVIVRRVVKTESAGGIARPGRLALKCPYGEVISAGPPTKPHYPTLKPGDMIGFFDWAAQQVDPQDENLILVNYEDILGYVKE